MAPGKPDTLSDKSPLSAFVPGSAKWPLIIKKASQEVYKEMFSISQPKAVWRIQTGYQSWYRILLEFQQIMFVLES